MRRRKFLTWIASLPLVSCLVPTAKATALESTSTTSRYRRCRGPISGTSYHSNTQAGTRPYFWSSSCTTTQPSLHAGYCTVKELTDSRRARLLMEKIGIKDTHANQRKIIRYLNIFDRKGSR